ncbi:DUF6777 domain-containing protein [Streptomyces sp. NPDC049577]|uniref:DUF6777 domain-containing protein n=1 Tax=Streptomyces sp. NPDC049577 TaxID=3155153 RepID=UPI00341E1C46
MRLNPVARLAVWASATAMLGAAVLTGCSSGDDTEGKPGKKTASIALEPAGVVAPGAFVSAPATDLQGVRPVSRSGGQVAGDSRGAFGGTHGATRCDKARLVSEITADRLKAGAWAKARGIAVGDIARHIDGLTEAALVRDTLVENHNYQGEGRITAYLSVLQVGVTVLVDGYGQPAVKCNCGNPLGEPDTTIDTAGSTYNGRRWDGFSSTAVAVITPRPEEKGRMDRIPLVDPYHPDKGFDRQTGSDGSKDTSVVPVRIPTGGPSSTAPPSGTPSGTPSGPASGSASGSASAGSGSPSSPGSLPGSSGPASGASAGASGSGAGASSGTAGSSAGSSPGSSSGSSSGSSAGSSHASSPSSGGTGSGGSGGSRSKEPTGGTHATGGRETARVEPTRPVAPATPPRQSYGAGTTAGTGGSGARNSQAATAGGHATGTER